MQIEQSGGIAVGTCRSKQSAPEILIPDFFNGARFAFSEKSC
jgi:hypothetical protein